MLNRETSISYVADAHFRVCPRRDASDGGDERYVAGVYLTIVLDYINIHLKRCA